MTTIQPPVLSASTALDVKDLRVHYRTSGGDVIAVNGIDFKISQGETLGLVGESGSGKSTTAAALLGLISPPAYIKSGEVHLNNVNVLSMDERAIRRVRWSQIAMIPQGSMNSLNPVMTVGQQIADVIQEHEGRASRRRRSQRIAELLATVDLPTSVASMYPHELSGGMKQRACIAMAIALNPHVIIADEPTSALDVVMQRTVAAMLMDVKRRFNISMLLIGHDMALQAQLVDRIAVMYAGNIVEIGPVTSVFAHPQHAYTQQLIASVPTIGERKPLVSPTLTAPDLRQPRAKPIMKEAGPNHFFATDSVGAIA